MVTGDAYRFVINGFIGMETSGYVSYVVLLGCLL